MFVGFPWPRVPCNDADDGGCTIKNIFICNVRYLESRDCERRDLNRLILTNE